MEPAPQQEDALEPRRWPLWRVLVVATLAALLPLVLVTALFFWFFVRHAIEDHFATRCSKVKRDVVAIACAVDQYAIENNGRYPESIEVLVTPDENGFSYLGQATVPRDPWGREYGYTPPDPQEYRVYSLGSDGQPGGEGDARDIDNIMIRKGEV